MFQAIGLKDLFNSKQSSNNKDEVTQDLFRDFYIGQRKIH